MRSGERQGKDDATAPPAYCDHTVSASCGLLDFLGSLSGFIHRRRDARRAVWSVRQAAHQRISRPPLMSMVAPVMKPAIGLATKTMQRAISSGVANR
jgi:hypothetical protein